MLSIGDAKVPLCTGLSRRSFLQVGATGLAGLNLPELMRAEAAGVVNNSAAAVRNCITLFLVGSPGHLDTWDMKPEAPSEIRGKFRPIATNVPGIDICEHFPQMARLADRFTLIRSLHHTSVPLHDFGQRYMMTGYNFGPHQQRPYTGSVVARLLGRHSALPASVVLPCSIGNTGQSDALHGQSAAYLGSDYEPTSLSIQGGCDLHAQLDGVQRRVESHLSYSHDTAYQRAFSLVTSPPARQALGLSQEPEQIRDRYGRNILGESCLTARRLIERGVRDVTVNHFDTVFNAVSWDMHANGSNINITFDDYQRHLCPQLDQAYSALILDLEDRGLLSETVVPVLSEMGRTPRLNPRGGRDHHSGVWTNFLAGGSIRGGQVIGASDPLGFEPYERPVEPAQILASIYHAMGIDLNTSRIPGPDGQPTGLIDAELIAELF